MQRAVSCYGVCPENFKVNVIVPGTITEQDEQYVEDLFDSFCDVTVGTPTGLSVNLAKLAATMLSGYAWAPLPRVNVFAEENFEAPKHQRPNVEPITHSRFTDAQRKRAMKEAEDEDAEAEAQLIVGMTGKALDRGSKHLSKQAVAALRKYQACCFCGAQTYWWSQNRTEDDVFVGANFGECYVDLSEVIRKNCGEFELLEI